MKKLFTWLYLLTKRLYKKPTFLVILLLIPLLSFGYSAMTEGNSGMMTVALATEEETALTEDIFTGLKGESQLIQYRVCSSPTEARLLVETGKADAAWVFGKDLESRMERFSKNPCKENAFVEVLQREENVALMLSRERLSGIVYPYLAKSFYLHYIRENVPDMDHVSDKTLLEYFDGTNMEGQLFSYDHDVSAAATVHYLMAPVRGLLAIVIALCGMAAAMYYIKDQKSGTFAWVPQRKSLIPEFGCQVVSVFNISLVALVALLLTGLAKAIYLEILVLILYTLCVATFSMMLRALFGSIKFLGSLLPLLVVAMILICPVFFDLGVLRIAQFALPPTYYVNSVYNPMYLLYMVLYTLLNLALCSLFKKLFKR